MINNPHNDKILSLIINRILETADPDKIILFGSRTMGKSRDKSDYDVCVLKDHIKNHSQLEKKIYLNLFDIGAGVDVILVKSKEYAELKNKWFLVYSEIDKYGKVVYEK